MVLQTKPISEGLHLKTLYFKIDQRVFPCFLPFVVPCAFQMEKVLVGLYKYGRDAPSGHNCSKAPLRWGLQA